MEIETHAMKAIGYFAVFICGSVVNHIVNGWALTLLWAWFVVATFDVRPLSIPAAIGLSLVVGYLTYQFKPDTKEDKEKSFGHRLAEAWVIGVTKPLFALLIGVIVKQWM